MHVGAVKGPTISRRIRNVVDPFLHRHMQARLAQPIGMNESILAGCAEASRGCLLANVFSEPVDRGLYAAHAVRYPQGVEANLDNAEYTQDHRRIDVSHVRDPKSLAGQFTYANAKHNTAFVVAIVHQLARISVAIHDNGRDCVGTLVCFRNVEPERMALRPPTNGTAHRLCKQAMP